MSEETFGSAITRRHAIARVSALLGGVALVGGSSLLSGCARESVSVNAPIGTFSVQDQALLAEVADTILPETATPGAKAAGVGPFMAVMVTDCYTPNDQEIFAQGMTAINEGCRTMHNTTFMEATPEQRTALLMALDAEQRAYMATRGPDDPTHYFRMIRELTMLGYFTSEIGYRQAMRYVESPGRYDPCLPHVTGEKTWAPHA